METVPTLQTLLDTKGYLTINQLVHYLKEFHPLKSVSYPALQRYAQQGYLECDKLGGQYRVSKASIEHYIEHGTSKLYKPPSLQEQTEDDQAPINTETTEDEHDTRAI